MYGGHIVESGPTESVLQDPKHPYTQLLLSAVPDPRAPLSVDVETVKAEPPRVINPGEGCRFRSRCPIAEEICSQVTPRLVELAPRHDAACHVAQRNAVSGPVDPGVFAQ
jgi:peptide/nickel transport system ATP-binding protein